MQVRAVQGALHVWTLVRLLTLFTPAAGADSCVQPTVLAPISARLILTDRLPNKTHLLFISNSSSAPNLPELAKLSKILEQDASFAALAVSAPKGTNVLYRSGNLSDLTLPSYQHYFNFALNESEPGIWGPPFWDCYLEKWLYGFSVAFRNFEGSIGAFYLLDNVGLNQCDQGLRSFYEPTACDTFSTKCVSLPGHGLQEGGYRCECLPGFVSSNPLNSTQNLTSVYKCVPECIKNGACSSMFSDTIIRALILSIQIGCMCITFIVAVIIFQKRKCKAIATGMWTVLETILLGIFLLYFSVIIYVLKPSTERCILEPWCRELGFIICYGAIVLKLYRILMEFRTRKARRWVVRDKDLLTYLCGMVVVTAAYLAAWTVSVLDFLQEGFSISIRASSLPDSEVLACKPLWWNNVTQTGEMLFLLFGLRLGFAARNASVQFNERSFLSAAVFVELIVSFLFYIFRFFYWSALTPTNILIAAFIRSQLTNSFVLFLIFSPKFWYQHKQAKDLLEHSLNHELSDVIKADKEGIVITEVELAEISISDMNPEDIKMELKRVYTQLQVLKNKTLRYNNPHISKKRGGRKVAHRRFSLQTLLRHRSFRFARGEHSEGCEVEVSRTPEESVCSIDGGPGGIYYDPPSTAVSENIPVNNSSRAKHHELAI